MIAFPQVVTIYIINPSAQSMNGGQVNGTYSLYSSKKRAQLRVIAVVAERHYKTIRQESLKSGKTNN